MLYVTGRSHLERRLQSFFSDEDNVRRLLKPMVTRRSRVSLRVLDWLVCNMSKKRNLLCKTLDGQVVGIHAAYKLCLSVYRRSKFDPFRRGQRLRFTVDAQSFETTVGQAHFILWSHLNGITDFAVRHYDEIEADMLESAAQHKQRQTELRKQGVKVRRSTLSHTGKCKCHLQVAPQEVSFDL